MPRREAWMGRGTVLAWGHVAQGGSRHPGEAGRERGFVFVLLVVLEEGIEPGEGCSKQLKERGKCRRGGITIPAREVGPGRGRRRAWRISRYERSFLKRR